ncbi:PIN domain-containing protein [Comamonas sp.]|uniref:PIN domain-containing protein n=1 Tax=Comamonas sp. TaxID=34028 RepID=UPI002898D232|nr:PIN domain-containing protein [Comamonas sp.]
MPIALILDTNVLRQEGLNSRNMQILRRLTSSGEVDLLVHEVVAREFKSQRTLEVQAQVEKIADAITEMGRQVDAK